MSNDDNTSIERVEENPHDSPKDFLSTAGEKIQISRWNMPPNKIKNHEHDSDNDVQEFQLRWFRHGNQLSSMVASMENDEDSSDVTVVTSGDSIPAHRLVLAAASPFFCKILQVISAAQHPVIYIKTVRPHHLRYLISFCYQGTVTLHYNDLQYVLQLAEDLEIRGLKLISPEDRNSPSLPVLQRRLLPTPSSTWFPFTYSIYKPSSSTPCSTGYHDLSSCIKRTFQPSEHMGLTIKKPKFDCSYYGNESRPHSNPSIHYKPPGSAPPILPALSSSIFFNCPPVSPPNSAPPQIIADSPLSSSSPIASDKEQEYPGICSVPHSSLLQPPSSSSPNPPSPQLEHTSSSSLLPTSNICYTTANMKETSTSSIPSTPYVQPDVGSSIGGLGASPGSRILLWRFLLDLLHNPLYTPMYIRWIDRPKGIFRIMDSDMVAQLWGRARKNSNMNYEKMSRGMRTYYKRGILFHIDGTKLIYKFNTSEPEIEQRMKYYDFTQHNSKGNIINDQNTICHLTSISPVKTLSPSPSSSAAGSLESMHTHAFGDVSLSQLPHNILREHYISFLKTTHPDPY